MHRRKKFLSLSRGRQLAQAGRKTDGKDLEGGMAVRRQTLTSAPIEEIDITSSQSDEEVESSKQDTAKARPTKSAMSSGRTAEVVRTAAAEDLFVAPEKHLRNLKKLANGTNRNAVIDLRNQMPEVVDLVSVPEREDDMHPESSAADKRESCPKDSFKHLDIDISRSGLMSYSQNSAEEKEKSRAETVNRKNVMELMNKAESKQTHQSITEMEQTMNPKVTMYEKRTRRLSLSLKRKIPRRSLDLDISKPVPMDQTKNLEVEGENLHVHPETVMRMKPNEDVLKNTAVISEDVLIIDTESPIKTRENDLRPHTDDEDSMSLSAQISTYSQSPSSSNKTLPAQEDRNPDMLQVIVEGMATPVKKKKSWEDLNQQESARKKHLKSGMAECLKQLIFKEQSAISTWKFELIKCASNNEQPKDYKNTLTLSVVAMKKEFSTMFLNCTVVPGGNVSEGAKEFEDGIIVSMSIQDIENLGISLGQRIKIDPPWGKLKLPVYKPVIVSPSFLRIDHTYQVPEPVNSDENEGITNSDEEGDLLFMDVNDSFEDDLERTHFGRTIADSVVGVRCGSETPVSFSALVQRVFCSDIKTGGSADDQSSGKHVQYSLLVQDHESVIGEIILNLDENINWTNVLEGESKVFDFRHLLLIEKTPLSRYKSHSAICGEEKDAEEYCHYKFSAIPNMSHVEEVSTSAVKHYAHPQVSALKFIVKKDFNKKIFSFVGKFLHQRGDKLFITDSTISGNINGMSSYAIFTVKNSCCLFSISFERQDVFFVRDAAKHEGVLILDEHSRVFIVPDMKGQELFGISEEMVSAVRNCQVKLEVLHSRMPVLQLAKVEGSITCIHEHCTWTICNDCGNHSKRDRDDEWYCSVCAKVQLPSKPIYDIEIFLTCQGMENSQVRVQLQQESIMKLLERAKKKDKVDLSCFLMGTKTGPHYCCLYRKKGDAYAWEHYLEEMKFGEFV